MMTRLRPAFPSLRVFSGKKIRLGNPWRVSLPSALAILLACTLLAVASVAASARNPIAAKSRSIAGNVIHNGAPMDVPAGTTLTFSAKASGAGNFTGAGTVRYDGTFSPGNSPALITYGGDVVFGNLLTVNMEIGGLARGTQYDALNVAGKLTFGGTLNIVLINGWVPSLGDTYNLFDWGTTAGSFTNINLPPLPAGRFWRTDRLYLDGTLRVSPVPATYAQWQAAFATGAFTADDDNDAFDNGIEFLFGTNPHANFAAEAYPLVELKPTLGPTIAASVTFVIPELPATDAHYRLTATDDFVSWTLIASKNGAGPWSGSASVNTDPPAGGYTRVTATEILPGTAEKRYHRLEAVQP